MALSSHVKRIVIPIHACGIAALVVLGLNFSWWVIPAVWLAWFLIGCVGVEVGLHRMFTHRAFGTHPWAERIIAGLGCLGAQGSPLFWASLHRGYHHAAPDTERDVHAPLHGRWHSYMGWMFTLPPNGVSFIYARDLLREPWHKRIHDNYEDVFWGIVWSCMFLGPVVWSCVVLGILLSLHQESLTNLLCHTPGAGYRNFNLPDQSRNVLWWGLLGWGLGYHNNHHAFPSSTTNSIHPWEIDPSAWVVRGLTRGREDPSA